MKQIELQRGIAALEFLLVAPLLIMVVLAVSEMGWAFHQYQAMTRATRDGARYAASNALLGSIGIIYLRASVIQQTSNLVVYGNVNGGGEPLLPGWSIGDITVTSPDSEHVTVSARYGYIPLVGTIPAFYGGQPLNLTFEMHSTVQMRAL
ncbi:MAG TPA: TadE family protein [Gammaproteobacteria bacterium]